MILSVQNLSIGYGGLCLLSGISLTVRAGEALTIRGQNGVGKSTCLATVGGLLPPLQGRIHNQFKSTTYLSLNKPIHPALTVGENLTYWSVLAGNGPEDISQALSYFRLDRLEHEPCAHLSAGQRQRLHLSRLFLSKTSLWILDEPYHSLDDEGHTLLTQAIEAHQQRGGAILMAQTMSPLFGQELKLDKTMRAA